MLYRIGFLQYKPRFLEIENNLSKLSEMLSSTEADLLVLPELAVSGYLFQNRNEVSAAAESPQNGPTADFFKNLAKKKNMSFVVGFAEKDGDQFYNSALLVNPDEKVYVYRKTHLFYEEKKWFSPGNSGFKVFHAKNGVLVGMMICFDWIFPESARTLSLRGAQIIAHPANLVLPWCQQAMITRSLENRVFSITANRIGREINNFSELAFTGMSQIISPKGEILKRVDTTSERIDIVEIDINESENKYVTDYNHILKDRRPELYEI